MGRKTFSHACSPIGNPPLISTSITRRPSLRGQLGDRLISTLPCSALHPLYFLLQPFSVVVANSVIY